MTSQDLGNGKCNSLAIFEDSENVYVECELPGIEPGDVSVSTNGAGIRVNGKWYIHLPVEIDGREVRTEMKNGYLAIILTRQL